MIRRNWRKLYLEEVIGNIDHYSSIYPLTINRFKTECPDWNSDLTKSRVHTLYSWIESNASMYQRYVREEKLEHNEKFSVDDDLYSTKHLLFMCEKVFEYDMSS